MEFSKLAEMNIADMTMEELAEFAAQATAIAKKAKDASKANTSALKAKYVADRATDSDTIQASVKSVELVGNYDKPTTFKGTIQTIDGVLHITDFSIGSAVRIGGVAASFSNGVKFTIDGEKTYTFDANSNLNFGEFAVGDSVELTNGKRVLLALGISVKAKAESAEASSTSKLRKLEDSVKARVGVVLADDSIATLDELLTASD